MRTEGGFPLSLQRRHAGPQRCGGGNFRIGVGFLRGMRPVFGPSVAGCGWCLSSWEHAFKVTPPPVHTGCDSSGNSYGPLGGNRVDRSGPGSKSHR